MQLPIMQEIMDMVYAAFPNVSKVVLPGVILGNNDVSPNYSMNMTSSIPFEDNSENQTDNPYFIELASGLAPKAFLDQNDMDSFEHGGYGVREVMPGLKIMQLNTIVYSPWSTCDGTTDGDCPNKTADPYGQFEWMREELARCREEGSQIYLASHLPPLLQTFDFGPQLWEELYVDEYLAIVQEYQDVIAAQLMAHVHSNELRAIPGLNEDAAPMIVHISIAPCYTTNPMVSIVHYDTETKRPVDLSVYKADLSADLVNGSLQWFELCSSLLEFLGLESLDNGAVSAWAASLTQDDAKWESWWNGWYKGTPQKECSGTCRQGEACVLSDGFLARDFESCNSTGVSPQPPNSPGGDNSSANALSLGSAVIVFVLAFVASLLILG